MAGSRHNSHGGERWGTGQQSRTRAATLFAKPPPPHFLYKFSEGVLNRHHAVRCRYTPVTRASSLFDQTLRQAPSLYPASDMQVVTRTRTVYSRCPWRPLPRPCRAAVGPLSHGQPWQARTCTSCEGAFPHSADGITRGGRMGARGASKGWGAATKQVDGQKSKAPIMVPYAPSPLTESLAPTTAPLSRSSCAAAAWPLDTA